MVIVMHSNWQELFKYKTTLSVLAGHGLLCPTILILGHAKSIKHRYLDFFLVQLFFLFLKI